MEDTNFVYNSTVILLLGLGSLISFAIWAWWLTKREKKPFGEVMSVMAVHQNESIFVFMTVLIFFAEAIVAASVHPPGEVPAPPLGRFLSHIIISTVGTVASVTLIKDIASVFEPKLDWVSRFARIFVVGGVGMFAVGTPLANGMLIAAGLGEDLKFYLFLLDYFTFGVSDEDFAYVVVTKYGGSPSYSSWSSMSYVLKTSVVMMFCHMAIPILEGFRNISSPERRSILFRNPYITDKEIEDAKKKAEREKKNKDDSAATEGEKRYAEKLDENLLFLLQRLRYNKDDDAIPGILKECNKILDKLPTTELKIKLASRIGALVNECKTLDGEKLEKVEREEKKSKLKRKIRALFENDPKADKIENKGFGLTLKGN